MKTLFYLSISFLALVLLSCEEVITVNPGPEQSQIAVEGVILNKAGESYVKLSYTSPYFSGSTPMPVTNAFVSVKDDSNHVILFEERSAGYYLPPADFSGVPGTTYLLSVDHNGKMLTSQSTMPDSAQLKKLRIELVAENHPEKQKGYYLYATLHDLNPEENYFKSEHFVNGIRQQKTAKDLQIFDDRFFQGLGDVEAMFGHWRNEESDDTHLNKDDLVAVRLYTLDKAAFNYLKALKDTPSQGGLYGKNPANVPSNIMGGLGLFYSAAYTSSEVTVN